MEIQLLQLSLQPHCGDFYVNVWKDMTTHEISIEYGSLRQNFIAGNLLRLKKQRPGIVWTQF
jgi:hypothetical protein